MGWQEGLKIATDRRTRCLESNNYRCKKCKKQFERGLLFTQPDDDACFCKTCWLDGEHKKYKTRRTNNG